MGEQIVLNVIFLRNVMCHEIVVPDIVEIIIYDEVDEMMDERFEKLIVLMLS